MPLPDDIREFAGRLNLHERLEPFRRFRWTNAAAHRPVLHLEDVSAIPFLSDIAGVEEYQHRARVRARPGDWYATVTPPDPHYEEYCEQRLDLGHAGWLEVSGNASPLAVTRGCRDMDVFTQLVKVARAGKGLTIHPYMSIDETWSLATTLSAEADVPMTVLGPPPPVT